MHLPAKLSFPQGTSLETNAQCCLALDPPVATALGSPEWTQGLPVGVASTQALLGRQVASPPGVPAVWPSGGTAQVGAHMSARET